MPHPHRGRGPRKTKRRSRSTVKSIAANLKRRPRSIRAAQRIAAGTGRSTRGIKLLTPGPRVRTVGGKTVLARLIRQQKRKKIAGPPKVGFRTVKGRGGKLITIKRPRPRNT